MRHRIRVLLERRIRTLTRRRRTALRHGTPGSIHDLRVATRRLQEALDVFTANLPGRERVRLRRRARSIRRRLANLRDADVTLQLLRRLRTGGALPPGAAGVAVLERRILARARGLRRSHDGRFHRNGPPGEGLRIPGLRKRASALLGSMTRRGATRVEVDAARIIESRARVVRGAMHRARSLLAVDLHLLRIAMKRYRYTLETLEEWGMKDLSPAIDAARGLQERLGNVHDLDVLIDLVRRTRVPGLLLPLRAQRLLLSERVREAISGFRCVDLRHRAAPLAALLPAVRRVRRVS